MEAARADALEQRMGNVENTLDEIRLLLRERSRPRQRQGRTRRRPSPTEEGNRSDGSMVSGESRPRFPRYQGHRRKLEIPIFKGDDAYGWLVRIERYFRLNEVRVRDKLDAAVIALEDKAINWFVWWEEQTASRTWDEFKLSLIRRFQPGILQNPLGPLLNLKQKGTVMEFREQFETLVAPEKNDALMKRGAGGKEKGEWKDRGGAVKFRDPGDFGGAKRDSDKRGAVGGDNFKGKWLSSAELEDRHKKGLCFKCGDKWGRDHTCKFKHMSLRLCDWSSEEEKELIAEEESGEEEPVRELKNLQLSLHSREGFTSNKSFKVWVRVGERQVRTLIDSDATSNFITSGLVKELKLPVVDTPTYVIEVGNGEKVRNNGVCEGLQFNIQGVEFKQHFFIMELSGSEMVLGMDWLASLGNIEANFSNLCLKCELDGKKYTIQGDPTMCNSQATWKTMIKALPDEGMGFYIHTISGDATEVVEGGDRSEWGKVINEFATVFNMPSGLPPIREHDHAILLKPDANIPNLRPYRYPYYQKNEIEKIVKEMMHAGIIRHSTSPFSSPVLLVKKKDEGWRFCTGYLRTYKKIASVVY
ncbi:uncharacterized protein LOC123893785 [Trifolium pratense]|uniref:uncharacterized protein LOC123893785 n=1 Tax=Trifolium pratense TaxID=57577 RepID=UPI001E697E4A|nr:uncharacterized protein LOC123893785 [Trifolium pratense]